MHLSETKSVPNSTSQTFFNNLSCHNWGRPMRQTCVHLSTDSEIRAETWEHQVDLDCKQHFPQPFSFTCGGTICISRLFLVPTTTTF